MMKVRRLLTRPCSSLLASVSINSQVSGSSTLSLAAQQGEGETNVAKAICRKKPLLAAAEQEEGMRKLCYSKSRSLAGASFSVVLSSGSSRLN